MATITPTITYAPNGHRQLVQVQWANMASGDTGAPAELPAWADRSVQITGTFGDGTMTVQGSNDGTNYKTLTDPQGGAISKTSADLEQIEELTRYVQPSMSGTTGTGMTVTLLARRTP